MSALETRPVATSSMSASTSRATPSRSRVDSTTPRPDAPGRTRSTVVLVRISTLRPRSSVKRSATCRSVRGSIVGVRATIVTRVPNEAKTCASSAPM